MYYLGTKSQVQYYISKVDKGEQYNGTTSTWATPLQSFEDAEKYAVIKHNRYEHVDMTLTESLPSEFVNTEL